MGSGIIQITPDPLPVAGGLKFKAIAVGYNHTCGLTTSGTAYCWGDNTIGLLGADTNAASVSTPIPVAGARTYTAIAAGDYHTCAIAVGGAAYCWGNNVFGALGTGDSAHHSTPTAVSGGHLFKGIDGGNVHTCGLTTRGDVYCWGAGSWGQLGNGERTQQVAPVLITGNRSYTAISVGSSHSCALAVGSHLYCWGSNTSDQLAGTAEEICMYDPVLGNPAYCSSTPSAAAAGRTVRAVGAGGSHTCAIGTDGGAYCWGWNGEGQVGNGTAGTVVSSVTRVSDP